LPPASRVDGTASRVCRQRRAFAASVARCRDSVSHLPPASLAFAASVSHWRDSVLGLPFCGQRPAFGSCGRCSAANMRRSRSVARTTPVFRTTHDPAAAERSAFYRQRLYLRRFRGEAFASKLLSLATSFSLQSAGGFDRRQRDRIGSEWRGLGSSIDSRQVRQWRRLMLGSSVDL
jgi:hypothetical protein